MTRSAYAYLGGSREVPPYGGYGTDACTHTIVVDSETFWYNDKQHGVCNFHEPILLRTFGWLFISLIVLALAFWLISQHYWLQTLPPFKSTAPGVAVSAGNDLATWRQEQFRTYVFIASGVAVVFIVAIFGTNSWVRNIAMRLGILTSVMLLCIIAWIIYAVVYVTQYGNMFWEAWFRLPITYQEFPFLMGILSGLWGTSLISLMAQKRGQIQ